MTTKRPSKADYTAAKFRSASAAFDRAGSLVEKADKMAMDAIEQGARAVLKVGPLATEYVQGMGGWSFTVIVPLAEGGEFKEEIGGRDRDTKRLVDFAEDFVPEYAAHVDAFLEVLQQFTELHDTYDDLFGRPAAGNPMRFKATGPVTTDW